MNTSSVNASIGASLGATPVQSTESIVVAYLKFVLLKELEHTLYASHSSALFWHRKLIHKTRTFKRGENHQKIRLRGLGCADRWVTIKH